MYLPDVNVWLALTFESHAHHLPAKDWFEQVDVNNCAFCRMTQQGFLRLATNPIAFPKDALSLRKAWELYELLLIDERISFALEPAGIEIVWREYSSSETYSPKIWNDAFLAGFAEAGKFELVSFDKGFRRYSAINFTLLS